MCSSSAALSPRRGLADHGADEACGRGGGGGGGGRERRSDVDNEDDDDDEEEEQEEEEEEGRIVPALRIGADGSIQVDEKRCASCMYIHVFIFVCVCVCDYATSPRSHHHLDHTITLITPSLCAPSLPPLA